VREGLVGERRRCRGRDPHEIRGPVEAHRLDDLVGVEDLVLLGSQGSEERHGELGELDEPRVAEPPRLGRLGGDEVDPHGLGRHHAIISNPSSR